MARAISILIALLLSALFAVSFGAGCTLMTNDYSTAQSEDAGQDHDADHVDARDEDLKDCTPSQATSSYTLLRGPSEACGGLFCDSWLEMCLTEDRHYMVLQSNSTNVRWFDSCFGQFDDVLNKRLRCVSHDGHFIELLTQGNETSDVTIDGTSFWSLLRWSLDAS